MIRNVAINSREYGIATQAAIENQPNILIEIIGIENRIENIQQKLFGAKDELTERLGDRLTVFDAAGVLESAQEIVVFAAEAAAKQEDAARLYQFWQRQQKLAAVAVAAE